MFELLEITLKGRKYMEYTTPKNVEFASNYTHRECDRIEISYPRSGSHWFLYIARLIISDGKNTDPIKPKENRLECLGEKLINEYRDRDITVMMTHLPWDLLEANGKAKYLVILRNPKDVCVSRYVLKQKRGKLIPGINNFHDFVSDFFCDNKYPEYHGNYFEYTRDYWQHRSDPNFTVLIYEDMKRNPRKAIEKIAEFLGPKYKQKLSDIVSDSEDSNSETLLDRIVRLSDISAMKPVHQYDKRINKGVVGNWRKYFSKDESDLIDQRVVEEWMGTGLEMLWQKEMQWEDI